MSEQAAEAPVKAMTKKLGPLPVYAYAVIIVGAAYGVYWWRNRVGVARPVQVTDIGSGISSAGPMPGTNSYNGATTPSAHAPAASQSNAQWAKTVADSLIALGGNPTQVNNAIAAFLGGSQLDATQQSFVGNALRLFGNPPEGVIPTNTSLDKKYVKYVKYANDQTVYGITATGQQIGITLAEWIALGRPEPLELNVPSGMEPATAPTSAMYLVKSGDTLASIATAFYGSSDGSKISSANPGVAIEPGSILKVPR
jgi:hypothetical protein